MGVPWPPTQLVPFGEMATLRQLYDAPPPNEVKQNTITYGVKKCSFLRATPHISFEGGQHLGNGHSLEALGGNHGRALVRAVRCL